MSRSAGVKAAFAAIALGVTVGASGASAHLGKETDIKVNEATLGLVEGAPLTIRPKLCISGDDVPAGKEVCEFEQEIVVPSGALARVRYVNYSSHAPSMSSTEQILSCPEGQRGVKFFFTQTGTRHRGFELDVLVNNQVGGNVLIFDGGWENFDSDRGNTTYVWELCTTP